MPTITLSVPEQLKKDMDSFKEVNWSEVTRELIRGKIERLKLLKKMDEMLKDSKLTDEDALRLGREVNKSARKRLEDKGLL